MRTRNVASKIILCGIPVFACVAAFGQQSNPPPPPPVFPSTSDSTDGQAPPAWQPDSRADSRAFPSRLTVRPGTWLPVRIEQQLSSDRNQPGENFYGTLADPIVVNGVVIAHRGQTVIGRITQAQKAGRVEGTSKLGLEITGITTADGEHVSIHTRILQHNGQSSVGRDLAAVGQATAIGAGIGAIAEGGKGAGMGAGIGAAAGLAGVLLTRGRATVVYPETLLTFELAGPVEIDTGHSGAFRYADSRDFERDRSYTARRPQQQQPPPSPNYGGGGYGGYGWGGPGWGYGYPGAYRGGFGIIIDRGFGSRGFGGGRRRRW